MAKLNGNCSLFFTSKVRSFCSPYCIGPKLVFLNGTIVYFEKTAFTFKLIGISLNFILVPPLSIVNRISLVDCVVFILNSFLLSNLTTMSLVSSGASTPSSGSIVNISLMVFFLILNPYFTGYFPMFFKVNFFSFESPTLTASKSMFTLMLKASASNWISCGSCLILNPSASSTSRIIL